MKGDKESLVQQVEQRANAGRGFDSRTTKPGEVEGGTGQHLNQEVEGFVWKPIAEVSK